jgi:hypothetical protein
MKRTWIMLLIVMSFALVSAAFAVEQVNVEAPEAIALRLIKFNGVLKDSSGLPLSGEVVVHFALYASQEGGESLWRESQLVKVEEEGHYNVFLGASEKEGLPLELFSTGKAQWLGVQAEGEQEQPRIVLVSVPYALKAADADKIGGEPVSSFVLNKDLLEAGGDFNTYMTILQQREINEPVDESADSTESSRTGGGRPMPLPDLDRGSRKILTTFQSSSVTSFGDQAGTTGTGVTFIGVGTGLVNTTSGNLNTFVGHGAGRYNTAGHDNSFLGAYSGNQNTTGYSNSFFGSSAGHFNTTGSYNSFIGDSAGYSNSTGGYNSFFGYEAGYSNTNGWYNSFFGDHAGYSNTAGYNNSFLGYYAGYSNTTGDGNSFIGDHAGHYNSTGSFNSFLGFGAGYSNTTASDNSFFGHHAGFSNTTGLGNSFLGYEAGYANTTGWDNSFLGYQAGYSNTTGDGNSFFGHYAGYANTTGYNNSFLGYGAGYSSTTGYWNTFLGLEAGFYNTTGNYNTATGLAALSFNSTGKYNTALGTSSGHNSTTGNYNIFLGAFVEGTAADTNTIRIGLPYDASTQVGQNQAYMAGIVENPLSPSDGPMAVGILPDGRLGTLPSVVPLQTTISSGLPTQVQPTAAETAPVAGSLLFLSSGATPPSGYTLMGHTDFDLKMAGNKHSSITIDVYMKY